MSFGRDLRRGGEEGADALRAEAVVPLRREEGRAARRDRLVRRDDEALLGVEDVRAGRRRAPSPSSPTGCPSPVRASSRPGRRASPSGAPGSGRAPGSRCGRRCRHRRGSARDGELGRRLAEVVPAACRVEGEDRVGRGARGQRRPGQRHGKAVGLGRPAHDDAVTRLVDRRGDVGHDRPVHGAAHGDRDVGAARDLDRLMRALEGDLLPVAQVGVAADLLEVEVGDVGAEVGHAPSDALVVADDDARHAREGEARHPEGAGCVTVRHWRLTWDQMPGIERVRCGSLASSGLPVVVRGPETTHEFEPMSSPRPSGRGSGVEGGGRSVEGCAVAAGVGSAVGAGGGRPPGRAASARRAPSPAPRGSAGCGRRGRAGRAG